MFDSFDCDHNPIHYSFVLSLVSGIDRNLPARVNLFSSPPQFVSARIARAAPCRVIIAACVANRLGGLIISTSNLAQIVVLA